MDIYNVQTGSDNSRIINSLQGKWMKSQSNEFIRLTMLKSLLFITSDIVSKDTDIDIELPAHNKFYIQVISNTSISLILIEDNANLTLSIPNGSSIIGQVYIK